MTEDATTTPEYGTTFELPESMVTPIPLEVEPEPEADKINLALVSETLNGYDQVALRARFHERFDQLAEDPMMFARAMYFVHLRRESHAAGLGFRDKDNFEAAMSLPLKDIQELFDNGDDDETPELDPEAVNELNRDYANFVIGTGLSFTLDQYQELTVLQRSALIEAANNR